LRYIYIYINISPRFAELLIYYVRERYEMLAADYLTTRAFISTFCTFGAAFDLDESIGVFLSRKAFQCLAPLTCRFLGFAFLEKSISHLAARSHEFAYCCAVIISEATRFLANTG